MFLSSRPDRAIKSKILVVCTEFHPVNKGQLKLEKGHYVKELGRVSIYNIPLFSSSK